MKEFGERKVLLSYVDVIDEVLFGGSKGSAERGWEREKRMVDLMGGMSLPEEPEQMYDIGEDVGEDESMDDDELPEWARKNSFIEDHLGMLFCSLPNVISSISLPFAVLPSLRTPALFTSRGLS